MSLRWGILGAARIADGVASSIKAAGCVVEAVASRDVARGTAFAGKHGCRAHASYEALLADPRIDAVYVPVPTAMHAQWALRCAEAGKPALVEKPFAMSVVEAERVFAAFAQRGLVVGEALMFRFHPLTRRFQALLAEGAIGALQLARASFSTLIPDPQDIRWRAETGGGALRDLGCYCVSALRMMAGEPETLTAAQAANGGVDAAFVGTMTFAGGALGEFSCSMRGVYECSYEAIGDRGRLLVEREGKTERIEVPAANHYQLMVESFARAVRGEAPYGVAPAETIANLRAIDRLLAAARPRVATYQA